jgi:large subunit ribosomal protein L25
MEGVTAVSEARISAELRTEFGKGGARRTRRAGKVPAVLYGHGQEPRHISLPARDFAAILRHGGMTQVLNIDVSDGTQLLALPKAIQRDPVRDTYDHVDLLIVRRGEKVTVDVPVHLVGEAPRDSLINQEHQTLSIIADATKLPEFVEASLDGLEVGTHILASQVKLPEGAELAADPDLIVAIVAPAPTAADLEEPTAEADEETEEAAEGEAAEATEE